LEESLSSFEYLLKFKGSIKNKCTLSHVGFGIKLYPNQLTCHIVTEKATEMAVYTVQVIVGSKGSNRVGI